MDEDCYYKQNVLSILCGGEGCREEYSSVCAFKHYLNEDGLIEEKLDYGWVFGRDRQQFDLNIYKITTLLKYISSYFWTEEKAMVQFWAAVEMGGGRHYLSTSNQPFCVSKLRKGACLYRKICMDRVYGVGADVDAEQLGSVGRVYRSKQPESTPDLRLYTTSEFPLRNDAARCGFRGYLALPLFDFHHPNQCFGVLEILSIHSMLGIQEIALALDLHLKLAGSGSTHNPLYRFLTNFKVNISSDLSF